MELGAALLLIFVLYLVDKHHLWRTTLKLTVWLIAISIVGFVAFYGWSRYDDHRTAKQQAAEHAAYVAKIKPITDCIDRNASFSNAGSECDKDPTVVLHAVTIIADLPKSPPINPHSRYVKAILDSDLTESDLNELKTGHMNAGDVATLLGSDAGKLRVKTADGQVGWADSGYFEVVTNKRPVTLDFSKARPLVPIPADATIGDTIGIKQ